MKNCLITKFKESVDNQGLLKVGELRIKVLKMDNPTYRERTLTIQSATPLNISIIGNGYFTDTTLLQNNGTTVSIEAGVEKSLILSNGDYQLSISDKYGLLRLSTYAVNGKDNNISFDLKELKYATKLFDIYLSNSELTGDISYLSNLKDITGINISKTNTTGELANFKELTKIRSLQVSSTKITGDLSSIKNLTNLVTLRVSSTKITGDLSSIKNLTNLVVFDVSSTKITGDLSSIKGLSKLTDFEAYGHSYFTGNLGDIPDGVLFFANDSKLKWEGSDRQYILALYAVTVENLDQMLMDMSNMEAKFKSNNTVYKSISVRGTRTSASDAAVATLQSKGYTVSITPA